MEFVGCSSWLRSWSINVAAGTTWPGWSARSPLGWPIFLPNLNERSRQIPVPEVNVPRKPRGAGGGQGG